MLGGKVDKSTILATTIRTTAETKNSKDMFNTLKRFVAKNSKKIGYGNFVFPGALEKLKAGWKLAPSIECDESLSIKLS